MHSQYKSIRTKIGYYSAVAIIDASIRHLRHVDFGEASSWSKFQPWYLFRLIKLAFIHGDTSCDSKRYLTPKYFYELFGMIQQLGDLVKMPNEYDEVFIFFRNMAFQQFWFQENLSFDQIARQEIIFEDFLKSEIIRNATKVHLGFEYTDITILILANLARFLDPKTPYISNEWFRLVPRFTNNDALNRFYGALSKDFWGFRDYFSNQGSVFKNLELEYYEETPLLEFPFYSTSDGYVPFSIKLLYSSFTTLLYDKLRVHVPDFMNYFGKAFEEYVGFALFHLPYKIYTEKDHQKYFTIGSKAVDFSFFCNGSLFLVDAKGGEVSPHGMVSHSSSLVTDKVKSIIFKGIMQATKTAIEFHNKGYFTTGLTPLNVYFIIVTYKDIYISNGDYYSQYINKNVKDDLKSEFGSNLPIPLENMFFITVRDLDLLIAISQKGFNLQEEFVKLSAANLDPTKRRFSFSQHLRSIEENLSLPTYLINRIDLIKKRSKSLWLNEKA